MVSVGAGVIIIKLYSFFLISDIYLSIEPANIYVLPVLGIAPIRIFLFVLEVSIILLIFFIKRC